MPHIGRKARALIAFVVCIAAALTLVKMGAISGESFTPTVVGLLGAFVAYIGGVSHEYAAAKGAARTVVAGHDVNTSPSAPGSSS